MPPSPFEQCFLIPELLLSLSAFFDSSKEIAHISRCKKNFRAILLPILVQNITLADITRVHSLAALLRSKPYLVAYCQSICIGSLTKKWAPDSVGLDSEYEIPEGPKPMAAVLFAFHEILHRDLTEVTNMIIKTHQDKLSGIELRDRRSRFQRFSWTPRTNHECALKSTAFPERLAKLASVITELHIDILHGEEAFWVSP